jgi:hypothetical protein
VFGCHADSGSKIDCKTPQNALNYLEVAEVKYTKGM